MDIASTGVWYVVVLSCVQTFYAKRVALDQTHGLVIVGHVP
jgi:hypothetical protein